ncbi:hypothetical protein [Nitrosomonas sp. PY1]|uniref:hypothetical protein n=1 Tax=Nitrosomonas sp. PY1 TaxID=1803906 RepID=UPI001FC84BF8|nr:hypothetical protein [Nitrosomonas sp. PY1]
MSFIMLLACSSSGVFAVTASVADIQAAVVAFQTIGSLRQESPINGDAIANAYTGTLQSLAIEVDEANNLELNKDIQVAIEDIKNGKDPALAAQVIDKTLQRVFYQSIWNRITAIRDEFSTSNSDALTQTLLQTEAAFVAIEKTVARENQVLTADKKALEAGTNPGLDAAIKASFARVKTALNKSNPDEDFATIQVERYGIRMSLARAYYIGVLREISGVISNRDADTDEAREALKEGEVFYRIIEPLIARDNPAGSAFLKSRLTGRLSEIDADTIVSELSKGLIGRVKAEMNGQASAVGSDRPQAMAEAAGAAYFAKIMFPDIELRLGTAARVGLETEFNNLQVASSENNAEKSTQARDAITVILVNYESALNVAKYETSTTTIIIDEAVKSFQAIAELRKQATIDGNAIEAAYQGDLQELTKIIDQIYGLSIDSDVSSAINAIKNQIDVPLAAQIVDKSLQRVFAIAVYDRTTLVAHQFDTLSSDQLILEWDRAYSAFQAISGTASRFNKVLTSDKKSLQDGRDPDLDYQILRAFEYGRHTLDKADEENRFDVSIARENIVSSLIRTYLIGVLREVEGIIGSRDTDVADAREAQVEGEYFYRIIEGFIAQDNSFGSNRIKAQLIGDDLAAVSANEIVSDISKGMIGQINGSINQIAATFSTDKNQALIAVEAIDLYASSFLPDLELRLDTLRRVKIENAIRNLKYAIQTTDSEQAIAAKAVIDDVLSQYQGQLI